MGTSARVILDSISPDGCRLTTMEVTCHRFVLAEFNTHRLFSRNSASSRAIPVEKQLERVKTDPALPIEWPCEQPGMQGGDHLTEGDLEYAQRFVGFIHDKVVREVEAYLKMQPEKATRLHKSLINRYLEPFMWHTIIVSSTSWGNFFDQRCSPLAQPEIRVAAEAMYEALEASTPAELAYEGWHTPLTDDLEPGEVTQPQRNKISVARCARVSYLTHDGRRDWNEDLMLYERLVNANPMHASPLEHVAQPVRPGLEEGNFRGYQQWRHIVQNFEDTRR